MPKESPLVKHDDPCDMVIELRNEMVAYKKEQRSAFWKKLTIVVSVSLATLTTGIGSCAYVLDKTSARFNEQRATDEVLKDRMNAQEKKADKTDVVMQQMLEIQKESKDDIKDIREAQHRIEISIANDRTP